MEAALVERDPIPPFAALRHLRLLLVNLECSLSLLLLMAIRVSRCFSMQLEPVLCLRHRRQRRRACHREAP
jgi:hypothetical protein